MWGSVSQALHAMLERRRVLVGINRRNIELIYPNNPRDHYLLADDKLLTKECLTAAGVPVPRTLAVCTDLADIPQAVERIGEEESFVIKPASSSGGQGIVVVTNKLADGLWRRASGTHLTGFALQQHLAEIIFGAYSGDHSDRAFIEERVTPHELFADLWADGLCDIRIITLATRPIMAMVRIPTTRSAGRANLHQGGIGLAIDLATGKSFRAWSQGTTLTVHPESGGALIGLTLPHWPDVLETARRAGAALPLGYLGTDIVVDAVRGPLVLEVNVRPGLEIQNVNGRALGTALEAT